MAKTLKISDQTHQKLKVYCAKNNIKMGKWVEDCLVAGLKIERAMENAGKINNQ